MVSTLEMLVLPVSSFVCCFMHNLASLDFSLYILDVTSQQGMLNLFSVSDPTSGVSRGRVCHIVIS